MNSLPIRPLAGLLGLLACFALASCENTKKEKTGYDDVVDYTSPNTRLSKEEYPFDDDGNYREDWAARGAGVSGVKDKPNMVDEPYVQEAHEPSKPTVAARSTSGSSAARKPASSGSSSSSAASRPKPKPAAKPKPKPKPTYVTVKPGDTLYAISKRTGASVASIKAANGLKSDMIRDGRSLKIPAKR